MNQDPTGNKPFSSSKPPVYIPPVQRPGQTPPMYHPPSEPLHEQLAQDGKTSLEKREHPDSANRQTGPAAASKSPAAPPASQPDAPTPGTVPAAGRKSSAAARDRWLCLPFRASKHPNTSARILPAASP